ncbi:Mut7-C RNAse domain-containing protein [Desulfosarcina sp.]|uniref:Mut7-C RNAse domain-containing protein n=1 Tax=Desulfosarcina sp. TaxID=2027861 RepID=UPI00356A98A1
MRSAWRFAAEATLGKLGRDLRTAGFDTLCQHQSRDVHFFDTIDGGRVILTRTRLLKLRLEARPLVFIRDNDPVQQMKQVVRELNLGWCDVNLFSRCLACNQNLYEVDREAVIGLVPAYVWQRQPTFHACGQCDRIYWAGSHHDRMVERLSAIFQDERRENQ